jgi:hypothetical protein
MDSDEKTIHHKTASNKNQGRGKFLFEAKGVAPRRRR